MPDELDPAADELDLVPIELDHVPVEFDLGEDKAACLHFYQ